MTRHILNIGAILLSTALFLFGNGLLGTLLPVRAQLEGFSDLEIGLMGSSYFGGFVLGCFAGPHLLARSGHIRIFAVAAAIVAAAILAFPLIVDWVAWALYRALIGFAAANLYMTLESWLNDRATNETRGRLLSAYVIVNLLALVAGQWLLLAGPPTGFELFSVAAMLFALCLIPVGLTRLPQPDPQPAPRVRLKRLFAISPVGVAGCVAVGLANGAFWTLAPLYATSQGLDLAGLAAFMSAFILGGAIVQWPLGRWSDRFDRRYVIAAVSMAASAAGLALGTFGGAGVDGMLLMTLVACFGAAMLPLYGLSIAHANDRVPREAFMEAAAGLLLVNALASVIGPTLAAVVTAAAGPASLFLYTAVIHAAMAVFAIVRTQVRESADLHRDPFEPVVQGSPAVLPLDPRGPEQEETAEAPA